MKTVWGFLIFYLTSATVGLSYRLPKAIRPTYYTLEILTHLGDEGHFNFFGNVWIEIDCLEKTKEIVLHSKNLKIKQENAYITEKSSKSNITSAKFEQDKTNDFFIIHLQKELEPGKKYEVFLPYSGTLQEGLSGYYKSTHKDQTTNETIYTAVTQFEPADARRAFPCFDEPAMKAKFKISLGRLEKYSSISNMPLEKTEPIPGKSGWFWDRFQESVPMSTYLVAFMVSDYGFKEFHAKNNVTFRIWARKDALDQVEFAGEVGPKSLIYFEDFFGIKYPLPKQDMVALPDFSAGAMENWGMITYREKYLLYDSKVSSATSQDGLVSVVAHELAHQWFGNLVTMKWWTDLWLNEGFATYMSTLAEDYLFPQWNSLRDGVVNDVLGVFAFDSLKSSHPVSVPIGHPDEIQEIFDTISYKKGSSLLRMMALFLGEETFREGVSEYLKKYQYSNAEQDDLWDSLTQQAHKRKTLDGNMTVKEVMDSWTLQTGFPVIFVNRNYEGRSADITQKRFLRDTTEKTNNQKWWIPLTYTTQDKLDFNDTKPKQWLKPKDEYARIEGLADNEQWVIFNIKMAGIYRVNYDEKNWELLIKTLNSEKYTNIPVLNRVLLLDDAADLAWVGQISYKTMMNLYNYLTREKEYLPWKAAFGNIQKLNNMMRMNPNYGDFKAYVRSFIGPAYKNFRGLVLPKTADVTRLDAIKHQVLTVSWACKLEAENCQHDALELFRKFKDNPNEADIIPRDLRQTIYCNALKTGNEGDWDFLWKLHQSSNVATLKNTIRNALACTRETWLLQRYLEWSLNGTQGIRKQDAPFVFSTVAASDVGYLVARDFFYSNLERINKYVSPGFTRLTNYVKAVAGKITTEYELEEFKNFIVKHNETFSKVKKGTDQALERAELNVQWQKRHQKEFSDLLKGVNKE